MPAILQVAGEAAHQLGLVPMAWVLSLRAGGRVLDRRWDALALAFAISYLADWVSHWTGTFPVGPVYVTLQTSLIVGTLAPSRDAASLIVVLLGALGFVALNVDPQAPDVLVHTIAWLGLLGMLWPLPLIPVLRVTFLLAFGVGLLAWWGYVGRPGWPSWLTYQSVRAVSLGMFCWASWTPHPLRAA